MYESTLVLLSNNPGSDILANDIGQTTSSGQTIAVAELGGGREVMKCKWIKCVSVIVCYYFRITWTKSQFTSNFSKISRVHPQTHPSHRCEPNANCLQSEKPAQHIHSNILSPPTWKAARKLVPFCIYSTAGRALLVNVRRWFRAGSVSVVFDVRACVSLVSVFVCVLPKIQIMNELCLHTVHKIQGMCPRMFALFIGPYLPQKIPAIMACVYMYNDNMKRRIPVSVAMCVRVCSVGRRHASIFGTANTPYIL